jgi:hypothetical protein
VPGCAIVATDLSSAHVRQGIHLVRVRQTALAMNMSVPSIPEPR